MSDHRSTLVLSPHQDDCLIRLGAYVAFAADRGDTLRLLNATNGAATRVGGALGLTREQTISWRDREQEHSWAWLTDGVGDPPTRLNLEDGQASVEDVRDALEGQVASMGGDPELYVATWWPDRPGHHVADKHPDHIACLQAAKDVADAHGLVLRVARHPLARGIATARYTPTPHQSLRIDSAIAAFATIGQRSAGATFRAFQANKTSEVTT